MFYIHQNSCISPQQTFSVIDLNILHAPTKNKFLAIEPTYAAIPPSVLRRMGKAVRMGVGTAMPLLENNKKPDGIIIGTANSVQEDCVKFLNQIIEYKEGMLTPINFVQSAPNAVAAQIGFLTKNNGYNISHLHNGLSFEYAMIDVDMLLIENVNNNYLLGSVDDISNYNYNFEEKAGWNKKEIITNENYYNTNTPGSVAGEAAAMFYVNNNCNGAIAKVIAIDTLHNTNEEVVQEKLQTFLKTHLPKGDKIDILISGENGDSRLSKYYKIVENGIANDTGIIRFKHMCGELPTATAMALWLSSQIFSSQTIPLHTIKKSTNTTAYKTILIYNNYKQIQHSFILVSKP